MSSIGPGSISGMNLAATFAAAQRTDRDADRKVGQAAEQQRVHDQADLAAASLEDVGESNSSADRDADGRQTFVIPPVNSAADQEDEEAEEKKPRASDPDEDRGRLLDLEV